MKYSDIENLKDLKKYCNKKYDSCIYSICETSPFHSSPIGNYLDVQYSSPTGALGYREFKYPITWCKFNLLNGIIYSYDTPIGVICGSDLFFVKSSDLPFKSATTKKLVTILNRNFMNVPLNILYTILNYLNLELGWLE